MKPYVFELENLCPVEAFSAIADQPFALFFDSADAAHPSSRYSYVMYKPMETICHKNGKTSISSKTQKGTFTGDIFEIIEERLNTRMNKSLKDTGERIEMIDGLPPFQGGIAGFFGYDLVRGIEDLPQTAKDNGDMPDLSIGIYDQIYAYDHTQKRGWVVTHCDNESEARMKQKCFIKGLMPEREKLEFTPLDLEWNANFDAHDYKNQIRKIKDYITAGDIFQANMTQRFDAALPKDFNPAAHYLHLREMNAAPFSAYMNLGNIQISSASPERFLTVDQNRHVTTQPIKGTRPRAHDALSDKVNRHELRTDPKERAENTMIVDLMRNDLSRTCEAKSVRVTELCKVESFASVHHLVSTVTGDLKEDYSALDLLKTCFPGGSITGAPKIRAMEIIEELEPTRRGPYCGSMVFGGFNGTLDSSILIRTLVFETAEDGSKSVSFQTGGGIVADSDPDQEYQETFDKADAIFRSFEEDIYAETEDIDHFAQIA